MEDSENVTPENSKQAVTWVRSRGITIDPARPTCLDLRVGTWGLPKSIEMDGLPCEVASHGLDASSEKDIDKKSVAFTRHILSSVPCCLIAAAQRLRDSNPINAPSSSWLLAGASRPSG